MKNYKDFKLGQKVFRKSQGTGEIKGFSKDTNHIYVLFEKEAHPTSVYYSDLEILENYFEKENTGQEQSWIMPNWMEQFRTILEIGLEGISPEQIIKDFNSRVETSPFKISQVWHLWGRIFILTKLYENGDLNIPEESLEPREINFAIINRKFSYQDFVDLLNWIGVEETPAEQLVDNWVGDTLNEDMYFGRKGTKYCHQNGIDLLTYIGYEESKAICDFEFWVICERIGKGL